MALYSYQAYAKDGKKISGTIDAPSEDSVRQQLLKQNTYPISIELAKTPLESIAWYRRLFQRSVSLKDKILFTKQLAVLLKSGVPLLQSLDLLTDQFEGKLKSILINVRDDIKEGRSLAQGLSNYPNVFDTIYVQLVRAGEASGKLEIVLEKLVDYMERRAAIIKRVKSAMTYPLIQLFVAGIVVVALVIFVVPKFAKTFQQQQRELPGSTRLLMAISSFLSNHYLLLLGIIIGFIALFKYWKSTDAGGRMYDKIKLRIPIVGYFTRMGTIVQFSRTLGILLESGVNLAESLDIVVKIVDNRILKDTLSKARDKIIKEGKIAEFLRQTNIFPPIATYLIRTGEESGQLGFMLSTVANNYEDDLSEYADSLASKLEPLMLMVMAVVVGFVVLSIAQPMMQQVKL